MSITSRAAWRLDVNSTLGILLAAVRQGKKCPVGELGVGLFLNSEHQRI